MANSKHAHYRYNLMDDCFRNKSFSKTELLNFINDRLTIEYDGESIQLRQLDEDLKVFRRKENGFNAPLPQNIRTLKYSKPNFSISERPLLDYEHYLIDATRKLIERFEDHPKYNNLAEALIKFQDEEEQDDDNSRILFYDHNEEYRGIKYLKPLYLAIRKKQILQITFQGFKDQESKTFEFHPHVLKQYNRRWFVFGLNYTSGIKEWSIPLDERLIDFNVIKSNDYIESDTDWDTFFRTMVGVVRKDSTIEKVVLRFYNHREDYFKTKPFIPDYDEFFEEEKQNQVWFETIINKELMQQILSYGKDVEVLEPEQLKEQLRAHSEIMYDYYSN
tara:strand:- start:10783 stop:11781 length:999 start_codon:yes stop_codon:yes gene_type:complete